MYSCAAYSAYYHPRSEVENKMLTYSSSRIPATFSFNEGTGLLQLHIAIPFCYFTNTGHDIHNPPPALSPHSGEFDTNWICLHNQPIYKIKSGCQIVFHWFQLFILARRMFIPQLRGGRSVKQYNKTRLSQPEGVAHPIKKGKKKGKTEFSREHQLMDSLSEFYKAFSCLTANRDLRETGFPCGWKSF